MRIGILTLMHGYNYGGLLQCRALQEAFSGMGHEVEIIDFHPNAGWRRIRRIAGLFGRTADHLAVDAISSIRFGRQIHAVFENYRRHRLCLSSPCYDSTDLRHLMHHYDAMIVGSDQVWNLDWTVPEYFFSFADGFQGRLLSYAACFGHRFKEADALQQIGRWLMRFDAISVRNELSRQMVEQACGRSAEIVADPTLLVDFPDQAAPELPFREYILLYGLSRSRYLKSWPSLKRIAHKMGLPVVVIQSDVLQKWDMSDAEYVYRNPNIDDWIRLIRHASFVFTDSFHGSLISAKYQKPFLNYIGTATGSERVAYVVERYRLTQAYQSPEDYDCRTPDYQQITPLIKAHATASLKFISEAVK